MGTDKKKKISIDKEEIELFSKIDNFAIEIAKLKKLDMYEDTSELDEELDLLINQVLSGDDTYKREEK